MWRNVQFELRLYWKGIRQEKEKSNTYSSLACDYHFRHLVINMIMGRISTVLLCYPKATCTAILKNGHPRID